MFCRDCFDHSNFKVKYEASFGPEQRKTDRKRSNSIAFNTRQLV